MANAKAKLYYTKEHYLDSLPVTNGNIIFVSDARKMCLDMGNSRFTYDAIEVLETDAERQKIESPGEGFYFVEQTNVLWRWKDETWNKITPSNLSPVMYGDTKEDFPETGLLETLYFTDNGIYNWKEQLDKYNLIANANKWDSIE